MALRPTTHPSHHRLCPKFAAPTPERRPTQDLQHLARVESGPSEKARSLSYCCKHVGSASDQPQPRLCSRPPATARWITLHPAYHRLGRLDSPLPLCMSTSSDDRCNGQACVPVSLSLGPPQNLVIQTPASKANLGSAAPGHRARPWTVCQCFPRPRPSTAVMCRLWNAPSILRCVLMSCYNRIACEGLLHHTKTWAGFRQPAWVRPPARLVNPQRMRAGKSPAEMQVRAANHTAVCSFCLARPDRRCSLTRLCCHSSSASAQPAASLTCLPRLSACHRSLVLLMHSFSLRASSTFHIRRVRSSCWNKRILCTVLLDYNIVSLSLFSASSLARTYQQRGKKESSPRRRRGKSV